MSYYRKPAMISFALMILAICMVVAYFNGFGHGVTAQQTNTYSMVGYVVDVDRSQDCISLENTTGDIYCWNSAEAWQINDIVAMTMNDMGTNDVTDDQILDMTLAWTAE